MTVLNVPILIVSNNREFRNTVWSVFNKHGFSVNLEADLQGASKRVSNGIYKIIIVDESVLTRGESVGYDKSYWTKLWEELSEKWEKFDNKPNVHVIEGKPSSKKFIKSLNEIVQASFYPFFSYPCYNIDNLI